MRKDGDDISDVMQLSDDLDRRDIRVVCVIVARGASQRIPRKNVLPFCGKPLVEWSVIQARSAHLVTDVYVSTDDEEIANICRDAGAKILWRYEITDAGAIAVLPFSCAIRQIRETHPVGIFISILPTNPLKLPWDMDKAIVRYCKIRGENSDCYNIVPLVEQLETNIYQRLDDKRSIPTIVDKDFGYLDAAAACWSVSDPDWYLNLLTKVPKTDAELDATLGDFRKQESMPTHVTEMYYYPVEKFQAFDIDLPGDWELSKVVMEGCILQGNPYIYSQYLERTR